MKRIFILACIFLMMCGCSKEDPEKELKHYDLSRENVISHTYYAQNQPEVYVVADMTLKSDEIGRYGIFYQVSTHDYILIDEIESSYQMESIAKFYDDKLYVTTQGTDGGYFEYTLEQEKLNKKELKFEFYKGFWAETIKDVKDGNIYYSAMTNEDESEHTIRISLKCSLSTYKCQLDE